MRFTQILPALGLALLSFSAAASSNNPCRTDMERLCKPEIGSPSAIMDCMRRHREEISPECRTRQRERREACAGDVDRFCAPVKGQPTKVVECLKDHLKDLSDSCRTFGKRGA